MSNHSSPSASPSISRDSPVLGGSPIFASIAEMIEGQKSYEDFYEVDEASTICGSPDLSGGLTSVFTAQSNASVKASRYNRPFRSRIQQAPPEKIWLERKPPRQELIATWIVRSSLVLALCVMFAFLYGGWTSWETNKYCLVLEDDFSTFDNATWTHEIESGGFGNGEFSWTTPYQENSYVKDGKLFLVPTIGQWPQTDLQTLNLTQMGICTVNTTQSGRDVLTNCASIRNQTAGTYIPPIKSARITTRNSVSIRYGRVEVRAKLPIGDWIWPAIWMLPRDNAYGQWPESGEIDIAESRGNGEDFVFVNSLGGKSKGGHNTVVSTLHWGPVLPYTLDQAGLTTNGLTFPSGTTSLTSNFHTFGMEWTPNSIKTYVDKRLTRVAYFKTPSAGFWNLGRFGSIGSAGGYSFTNPWIGAPVNAPFDQEFYLILNLAVGGLGYFNTIDGKLPWNVNKGRDNAMNEFMSVSDSWKATWGSDYERGLVVDNVKMWKICN